MASGVVPGSLGLKTLIHSVFSNFSVQNSGFVSGFSVLCISAGLAGLLQVEGCPQIVATSCLPAFAFF